MLFYQDVFKVSLKTRMKVSILNCGPDVPKLPLLEFVKFKLLFVKLWLCFNTGAASKAVIMDLSGVNPGQRAFGLDSKPEISVKQGIKNIKSKKHIQELPSTSREQTVEIKYVEPIFEVVVTPKE
ncbi:unnamed protein product [Pocillopora meandrina]|uniref:Alpha-L-arabinofuranosidase C-terminal domain-containing protein n=1 Tax=Pocillopora meandrina TaxID=46732 RepID=A0AAU9VRF2_9CNID|nr:unnamed protein product [Pocillopora meandrina]